jgi:hypothetical protein
MMRRRATRARPRHVALAGRLLGAALLLDVAERRHRPETVGQLERRGRVGDAHDRAVLAHEPVLGVLQRLPRLARPDERTVLLGERRPVGVLVVHGVVRGLAHQLRELGEPEGGEGGRIGVVEATVRIGDPHGLADRRQDRLALAQGLLSLALLLDVLERDDDTRTIGHLDRRRGVGHREHRAVATDEPVLVHLDRLTRPADLGHGAVLGRIRRSVAVLVVDGVVTEAAAQLGQIVIAQRREAGGIDVDHEAVVIDHPDRLGDGGEDRLHRGELARRLGVVHGSA